MRIKKVEISIPEKRMKEIRTWINKNWQDEAAEWSDAECMEIWLHGLYMHDTDGPSFSGVFVL